MKILVFAWVVLCSVAGRVSAQVKGVSAVSSTVFKEMKKPPLNWPLLSFLTDSIYGMEVNAYEAVKMADQMVNNK